MLLSLNKTSGHSMEPKLKNGSFFLSSELPYLFNKPKLGDIIVFKNDNKNIVKKIIKIDNDKYFTEGINLSDTSKFNTISRKEILGKLIWIF